MKKRVGTRELGALCRRLRKEGKTVVFTNGCFDIIHRGHVGYLRRAKRLGDVLVVGLNSDRSVSRIKPGRPINGERDRAAVLEALEMVDYVAIFDEPPPYRLIRAVRPDVLVKGGDWKTEEIVGSDIAKETLSLPYLRGASTTRIIEKIRKSCR